MKRRDTLRFGAAAIALGVVEGAPPATARHQHGRQRIFVSSNDVPLLQLPEGLTSSDEHVFVGTYNYLAPQNSRIFVFDADTGDLQDTIGDKPGQDLVSAGALLGLSIHPDTEDLYANANQAGESSN